MSDEAECKLLDIPDSYKIDYAPTQVNEMGEVIKASITVAVDLTNIMRVSENMDIFEAKLILHLSWFDNRLQFNNLKLGKKNMLAREGQSKIWSPPAFFENTKDSERIVNDDRSSAYVTRNGSFKLVGYHILYNTQVFLGEQNYITLSRIYRHEFICIYQMAWYPFDSQRCQIVLSLVGDANEIIYLFPGKLKYLGPKINPIFC